ncbi:MAG: YihY/virulence factor BrkB family protein [Brumimicrobium sp.]
MKKFLKSIIDVIKIVVKGFDSHNTMAHAGSIAFYMIFSLPGLLITSIAVAGVFIGQDSAQLELSYQLSTFLSDSAIKSIDETVENIDFSEDHTFRTIIGVCVLLFSATTVFVSLQNALNKAWDIVATPKKNFIKLVLDRLLSFGMVVCLGFIMIVSLLLDTIFNFFFNKIESYFGETIAKILVYIEHIASFGMVLIVFMFIFKFLPDAKIKWKDVFKASLITTTFFVLGKFLLGIYIDNSNFSETYQAAGSIIIILIWVYFSTIMVLLGAEIVSALKLQKGEAIYPNKNAKKIKQIKMEYDQYIEKI